MRIHKANIERMSPSKLGMWSKCQAQWKYAYIDGIRRPPSAAMRWGTAFDDTANSSYLDKLISGETPASDIVAELFASAWGVRSGDVEDWGKLEKDALTDQGVDLARQWREGIAIKTNPVQVQPEISVQINASDHDDLGSFIIRGYADLIAEENGKRIVIDHKAGARRWSEADAIRSIQPAIYTIPGGEDNFAFHIGVRAKKKVSIYTISRTVGQDERLSVVNRMRKARRQIAHASTTGDFMPNREHQLCSKRWCGFWKECVADHGGVVAD